MNNIFTKHPHSIGESYFHHLKFAFIFGLRMTLGGLSCIIHAVFPFLFQKTASNILLTMANQFVERMPPTEKRFNVLLQTIDNKFRDRTQDSHGNDSESTPNCA